MAVLGDGQLPHKSGTMDIIDPGDLRNDQADSAHGAGLVKGQHILGGAAVQFRQANAHGGHDQTDFLLMTLPIFPGVNSFSYIETPPFYHQTPHVFCVLLSSHSRSASGFQFSA